MSKVTIVTIFRVKNCEQFVTAIDGSLTDDFRLQLARNAELGVDQGGTGDNDGIAFCEVDLKNAYLHVDEYEFEENTRDGYIEADDPRLCREMSANQQARIQAALASNDGAEWKRVREAIMAEGPQGAYKDA